MKAFYEKKFSPIHIMQGENLSFPPHLHKELEIVVCLKGLITVTCNQSVYTLKEHDILYVFPNCIHSYTHSEHSKFLICIASVGSFPLFKKIFTKECVNPKLEAPKTGLLYPLLQALCAEYTTIETNAKDTNTKETAVKDISVMLSYLQLILALSFREMEFQEKKTNHYEDILPEILNYLEENYTLELNADIIASHFGINPSYLSRLISSRLQCTLTQYIHELRINYAKHLLEHSGDSITQIGFECGFQTQRSFNRVFNQITNKTPREYRKEFTNY